MSTHPAAHPTDSTSAAAFAGRRRHRLRIAGLLAVLLILLPVALIITIATLLPTELIARAAAERAEAALGVPVDVGELEIDFWPVPSVSLRETRLGNPGAPVARAERILLRPRLLPLLRGRVSVREIAIDEPEIRLVVDSAGALNLPFGGSGGQTPANSDPSTAQVDFAVDEFRIREGRLSYADARDGTEVVLTGLEQTLRLEGMLSAGGLARIGLAGRLSSDSVDATIPGRLAAPLRGVSFALEHDARLDRDADRLELADLRLQLQRMSLSGAGRIEAVSDSLQRTLALNLSADEFSFDDLARSLPEGFLAALLAGQERDSAHAPAPGGPQMEYGGRAAISARLSGLVTRDSIPRVEGTVEVREVAIARDGAPVIAAGAGTIAFANDRIATEELTGRLFGEPFTLGFRVDDLANPLLSFAARGTARVDQLLALAGSEEPLAASGGLPFDLRGELRPGDPARSTVEGTIGIGGVRADLPSLLQPVQISSGTLRFAGGTLAIDDLGLAFGESRVRLDATVEEWLPAALGDSTALALVRFDASAGTIDLDALLGRSESEYTPLLFARLTDRPIDGRSAAEAAAEGGLTLPELPRVRAEGNLRAQRLVRNGLTYEEVEAAFESSPTAVSAPRVRFGLMGGTVELGLALERREQEATLVAVYHLENVGASAFFSRFTPFQGRLSGFMTLQGDASLQLDEQMLPVRPTVRSSGKAALTSGSLANWPLLGQIGERLGLQKFDTLAFREWSGDFTVAGPLVNIERSVQLSDGVQTELAGSFDFGGKLDLGVVARLSPELVASAGEPVRAAAASLAGEGGRVPVGLRITGTTASPTVGVDLSAARDEALARARERATQEAEGAARRAAAEVARRALGDSTPAPGQIGEAVRTQVQDRIRGLFGRRTPQTVADSATAAPPAPAGQRTDSAGAAETAGGG